MYMYIVFTVIPDNDGALLVVKLLVGRRRRDERFWGPVVDQFIDLLFRRQYPFFALPDQVHVIPRL